jgi:DNA sulfur modification protein DndD
MRHEQSYTGLRINARYGLDIIYEDGSVVTNRATGEEQIVALALMGALQHSAPVQGPIVIDMPLGRLDQDHKYRVIAALPEMSEQVILLAFEGEFELNRARRDLMGRLVGERQLVRVSGRNTDIREVVS